MSRKSVAAIIKRETDKAKAAAKVTSRPAVTKAEEAKADRPGGSEPA